MKKLIFLLIFLMFVNNIMAQTPSPVNVYNQIIQSLNQKNNKSIAYKIATIHNTDKQLIEKREIEYLQSIQDSKALSEQYTGILEYKKIGDFFSLYIKHLLVLQKKFKAFNSSAETIDITIHIDRYKNLELEKRRVKNLYNNLLKEMKVFADEHQLIATESPKDLTREQAIDKMNEAFSFNNSLLLFDIPIGMSLNTYSVQVNKKQCVEIKNTIRTIEIQTKEFEATKRLIMPNNEEQRQLTSQFNKLIKMLMAFASVNMKSVYNYCLKEAKGIATQDDLEKYNKHIGDYNNIFLARKKDFDNSRAEYMKRSIPKVWDKK